AAPPVSQISSGPTFPPRAGSDDDPFGQPAPARPDAPAVGAPAAFANEPDPFASPGGVAPAPAGDPAGTAPAPDAGPSQVVSSPRFPLQYAVDDAGPGGPAKVELWVTQDKGRSWFPKGEDPDRTSPFPVDLGGEGTFGLRLVAYGATGQGDTPPAPG